MRLYPSLIVCLIVTVTLCWFITTEKSIWYWRGAWVYLKENMMMSPCFYLPGVFTNVPYPNSVNGSLWTLPIELTCFLILPILCIGKKRKSVSIRLNVIAIGMTIVQWILMNESMHNRNHQLILWGTDWIQAVRLVVFFIWGGAYSAVRQYEKDWFEKCVRIEVAAVLILVMACMGEMCPAGIRYLILPYVIITLGCASPIKSDFFNRHEYTYGMYLYAFPISEFWVYLCKNIWGNKISFIYLLMVVLSTTLVFAVLNKKLVEEPIEMLLKKNAYKKQNST